MPEVETSSALIQLSRETGLSLSELSQMSGRSRGLAKARARKRLKQQAQQAGLDPDAFVEMTEDEREEALRGAEESREEEEPPVYTDAPDVPPDDPDPLRRQGVTVGPIREVERTPDLVGDKKPRTLVDLYARWPVGDQQHYLRVERRLPKMYQNIPVAGHLTDVYERITEQEFARRFGGREFEVTLYGPDPGGRCDPITGLVRTKPLTDPISVTVPLVPPSFNWIPQEKKNMTQSSHYPFGGAITSEADAKIHRSNTDLITNLVAQQSKTDGAAVTAVAALSKSAVEQAREDARAREAALAAQLEAARRETQEIRAEQNRLHAQLQDATGRRDGSALDLVRALSSETTARDEAKQKHYDALMAQDRVRHEAQIDAVEKRYEEKFRALEERYDSKLNGIEERAKAQQEAAQETIRDERRRASEAEIRFRDELERVRRDAKEEKANAVAELKSQHEQATKTLTASYARDLDMLKNTLESEARSTRVALETQTESKVSFKELEVIRLNHEVTDLRQKLTEAQQEAKDALDPVKVAEKVSAQAAAFGFKKDEGEQPKGFDLFMATAGTGLGQLMSGAGEWLPAAVEGLARRREQQQQAKPQLQQGQAPAQQQAQPQQQQPQEQQRPNRVATWASAASRPDLAPAPPLPPVVQMEPAAPSAAQQQPQQPPQSPQPQPQPQASPQPQVEQPALPPSPFREFLPDKLVASVVQQLEFAINTNISPDVVLDRVLTDAQARPIFERLIGQHSHQEFLDYLKVIPGTTFMAIRRPAGQKFLVTLWQKGAERLQAPRPDAQPTTQS